MVLERTLSRFYAVIDYPLLHVLGRGTQPVSLQRCSRLSFTSCVGTWNAACRTSTLFQTVLSFVYMVMVQTLIDASGVQFAVMLLAVPDLTAFFLEAFVDDVVSSLCGARTQPVSLLCCSRLSCPSSTWLCTVQSIVDSSGVQFAVMWLANANSAVNVFIYSSTNKHFRRECVLLASRLCGSRFSSRTAREHPTQSRRADDSALSASNLSTTINVQGTAAADANPPDAVVTSSADECECAGVHLLTVPRDQFLIVDNMKHAVSIETLASNENDS